MSSDPAPSRSFTPFDTSAIEQSIPDRFRAIAARHGDRVAVWVDGRSLTYRDLDALSDGVAEAILDRRGGGSEPIVLYLPQGLDAVVAVLGTLKAGKCYVPIDPSDAPERVATILQQVRPGLTLTAAGSEPRGGGFGPDPLAVDTVAPAVAGGRHPVEVRADSPAYVFFTSGTTGTPKGTVDCHRNVLHNVMRYTNALEIGPDDRLTLIQSPGFSATVSTLFAGLLNGASVSPLDLRTVGMAPVAELVADRAITMFHAVPDLFESLLTEGRSVERLRVVRLEGDACRPRHVRMFQERCGPASLLAVGLGATETGLTNQYVVRTSPPFEDAVIPVGYPTEDMETLILDEAGKPLPPGAVGEIVIRSRYLATGYWHDEALTRERFTPGGAPGVRCYHTGDLGRLRSDGCLEHLGRRDDEIRLRGQRIDPAVLEVALTALDAIDAAVVAGVEDATGHPTLAAYLTSLSRSRPSATVLRRAMTDAFPPYLVPTRYVWVDAFPRDANGKLDRRALPPPPTERPELDTPLVRPRTALEAQIAREWEDLLGIDEVGIDDSFYDLGGESLRAMTMAARLSASLDVRVPPSAIIGSETVADLARRIEGGGWQDAVVVQGHGSRPTFFCVHPVRGAVLEFRDLSVLVGADQPFVAFHDRGTDSGVPVTVEDLATRYLTELRSRQPDGPYLLGGWSFGGLVAYEMACRLEREGHEVALVALLQTICPVGHARRRLSWRRHWEAMRQLSWRERLNYLANRLTLLLGPVRRLGARSSWRRRTAGQGRPAPGTSEGLAGPGDAVERIYRANRRATGLYRPGRFGGRLALIGLRGVDGYDGELDAGWNRLAGGGVESIELAPVEDPATEYLFQEPHLSRVASELSRLLGSATSTTPRGERP